MKVAISGGTGFIGNYLCKELEMNNIEPVILSREENECSKYKTIKTDYTYKDLLSKITDIDAFVHLAFKRGSHGRIEEFHGNEIMAQTIFDVCRDLKIKNVVNASTISVYSKQEELPWYENSTIQPELMYGISKFTNECIGNIYSKNYDINIKNLRIAHVYGFNEKNNYMINKFMRLAYKGNILELNNPAQAKREFVYAKDVARAIHLALLFEDSGTFNIGSGDFLTNEDVANSINKIFGNNNEIRVNNPNQKETICESYMNITKAASVLGYSPIYSFEDALVEIYSQMKELKDVPELY